MKITGKLAPHSYNNDFLKCLETIEKELGWDFFNLSGIGDQLDANHFGKQFFKSNTTADTSVDPNSNVSDKSVVAYHFEAHKPMETINALYRLWKGLIKHKKNEYSKQYTDKDIVYFKALQYANDVIKKQISGDIYINDITGISTNRPYCYNYCTLDIANFGIPKDFDGEGVLPPKHLTTYFSQLLDFMIFAGNSTLGAVGIADALITATCFFKKVLKQCGDDGVKFISEEDCWKHLESKIEKFLYDINKPNRANQSLFSNISIYDDVFLKDLCPSYQVEIDGEVYSADVETVKKVQDVFIKVYNKEQKRRLMTFPVLTPCFALDSDRKLLKKDFLKKTVEQNQEFRMMNFYGGETSTLSSCCFDGTQKVLTKSSNGVRLTSIQEVIDGNYNEYRNNFSVFHNGSWCAAKTVKLDAHNKKLYKIITTNNKEIIVTENHNMATLSGDKKAKEVTINDYLMFNTNKLDTYPERDMGLTYEQGVLIGAYLGDGSIYKNQISLSLNKNKYGVLLPILTKALNDFNISVNINLSTPYNNVYPVSINSEKMVENIKYWVNGKYCYEKEINLESLTQSHEFRQGIIDGFYITDGGNSNRIYTTSETLCYQIEAILTSLGQQSIVDVSDRTDEPVIIRGEEFKRNHKLYCIRYYTTKNKRSMGDVFKFRNNSMYFKIKSIEEFKDNNGSVYCFEMKNEDEPYFTLPNGCIVGNCRLRSKKDVKYMNTIGSGGVKIGSIGVVTNNLPRIARLAKDKQDFMNRLEEMVEICQTVNYVKRTNLKKAIAQGRIPLYTHGFININTQYNTVGVIGFNEMCENFGLDILSQEGQDFVLEVMNTLNTKNDEMADKFEVPSNCEQIPGENVAIKLATKDRLLGYNEEYDMYSNQFIPLISPANIFDRIDLQSKFDKHFGGGSILHINVDELNSDIDTQVDLIEMMFEKGVIYFAFNSIIGVCNSCGKNSVQLKQNVTRDNTGKCKYCSSTDVDVAFRVVGFVRKVKNWAKERRLEFQNRKFYVV